MLKKTAPLVAATFLTIAWAGPAPAQAANDTAVAAAAAAVAAPGNSNADRVKKSGTLYDRLGGIFAIAAVVDRFSDAIIQNPKLNKNPALVAWNQNESAARLPGLKFMRTLWVASLTGGPFEYTGLPLPVAHKRLSLTAEEFDEVGAEIVRALGFYKVPEAEKQELVSAYMKSKPQVVTASAPKTGGHEGD
jgi:hemoglobin